MHVPFVSSKEVCIVSNVTMSFQENQSVQMLQKLRIPGVHMKDMCAIRHTIPVLIVRRIVSTETTCNVPHDIFAREGAGLSAKYAYF